MLDRQTLITRHSSLAILGLTTALWGGCATDDDAPTTTGTDTDPTSTGSTSLTTAGTTGSTATGTSTTAAGTTNATTSAGTGGGGGVPGLDCPTPVTPAGGFGTPAPLTFTDVLQDPDPICSDLSVSAPAGVVEFYFPGDGAGQPAAGRFPVVVFHHGRSLQRNTYTTLFNALQSSGFNVVNVSVAEGATSISAAQVSTAMRCALRWFYFESGYFDHADCRLTTAGHSLGGLASHNMIEQIADFQLEPYLVQLDVVAEFLLAASNENAAAYFASSAVPQLVLGSSTDEDTRGEVLTEYDRMAPEDVEIVPTPEPSPYKGALWIYDLPHRGFGGYDAITLFLDTSLAMEQRSGLSRSDYIAKGGTITAAYVDRFLRWQVFHDDSLRPYFVGEAYPPEVLVPQWWDYLTAYTQRSDPATCQTLSAQECAGGGCAWDGSMCQGLPLILQSFVIQNETDGAQRAAAQLFEPAASVPVDTDAEVAVDLGPVSGFVTGDLETGHDTEAAFAHVENGGASPTATFSTETIDGQLMSHASMRLGVRSRVSPNNCETVFDDAVDLSVTIGDGINSSSTVQLQPLIQQDAVFTDLAGTQTGNQCRPSLFLATHRVPMADLCEGTFVDTENLESWAVTFPNGAALVDEVVVDSLELTRSQDDVAAVGTCPTQSGLWACEASTSLLPQRTVCTGEPTNGTCASGDTAYEAVDVPEVPSEWGGPYDGWVVHMPPGFSDDPWNPTTALEAAMRERCMLACQREYMDDPNVSADCSGSGAFVDVSLLSTPSVGPIRRIAPSRRDGSGFFAAALSSDLLDDACLAFDENMCPSAPFRTTPAEYPLDQSTEYLFDVDDTQSTLSVDANGTQDSVALYGTVGFSQCADGNATAPCPFALTSLQVKSIGSIKVPVTCPDGSVINRTLYNLDVHLGQPSFGVAEAGTNQVGFPRGGLVFDASFKQNANTIELRGPTEIDIQITASPSQFEAHDIPVHGEMPACWGQEDIPAMGTFDLVLNVAAGPLQSPPSISIDIPSSVSCDSSPVTLAATTNDPDGDLDYVRWYVDDVPIALTTSSIPFTTGHEVRAVAYDLRGAATTARKTIGCN